MPHLAAYIWHMRSIALALALTLGGTSGAYAYCPSLPDDASTHYVENQQALMLCRQQELSDAVRLQQQQAELAAQIQNLQIQMRTQQMFNNAQANLPQF
jgi:hypothetical protein